MTAPASAPAPGAANASPMGALSRLVQNANDSGISYQQMADKASRVTPLTKQYFQKLVKTPPVSPPNPEQLEAIANALGSPVRRVKEAAAEQWLAYEATELAGYDEEVRIIVGHLAGKSKSELRRWRAMIEADERAQREE
ncbi:hypothetical protein DT019_03370 [Streptomyces sp. SDr-06]|uniref:hypothetical protein n=1 Tax=Streptomyces sp. SDr-06 TaxID=2267702 RepID=UPI000DEB834C|nr:hypothetical protein [Streptomyces sp. SDr-06]RCH70544.1 hypothetical protein DT019_03370 [Streptomyces sp. SDr-06]